MSLVRILGLAELASLRKENSSWSLIFIYDAVVVA